MMGGGTASSHDSTVSSVVSMGARTAWNAGRKYVTIQSSAVTTHWSSAITEWANGCQKSSATAAAGSAGCDNRGLGDGRRQNSRSMGHRSLQ
jgi:hypothetical protein